MNVLKIKEGHLTDFTATVRDSNNDAIDLSAYDGVNFIMVNTSGTVLVNGAATFSDKTAGQVTYNFQTADVATPGNYKAYFSFTDGGVKKLASPTDYFKIQITEDLID